MSNALPWGKGLLSESRDDLTRKGASIPSNNSPSLRKGKASPCPAESVPAQGQEVSHKRSAGKPSGQHPAGWAGPAGAHRAAAGCRGDTQGKKADSQGPARTVVKDTGGFELGMKTDFQQSDFHTPPPHREETVS